MGNMNDSVKIEQKQGLLARIISALFNAIQDYFIRRRLDGRGL